MVEFRFPDVGEGIHEGELNKWLVKDGSVVEEHQPIAEVETDKAVVELPAPASGKIKLIAKEGTTIKVGEVIAIIGEEKPRKPEEKKPEKKLSTVGAVGELEEAKEEVKWAKRKTPFKKPEKKIAVLPAVRKLAEQLGVELSEIKGTGPKGRITAKDVRAVAKPGVVARAEAARKALPEVRKGPKVAFEQYGKVLRIPLRGTRKTISENLSRAFRTTVPVTHMDEIDVTDLVKVREQKKKIAQNKGYPLTYLPFVAKASVIALKEHPYVNSSLDDEKGEIVIKKYYNIGFAVDTVDGLIVPVVKGCDQKSILDIAKDMFSLAEQTRNREVKLEDLRGGTFTITNIGTLGGVFATPIINHPECAILGLGAIKDKPVIRNGKVVARKVLPVSLTFDHRIIDGAEAARFVNDLKKHLEDPDLMLLEAF